MKHHALFSSKDKNKKNVVLSAARFLGALRVNFSARNPGISLPSSESIH